MSDLFFVVIILYGILSIFMISSSWMNFIYDGDFERIIRKYNRKIYIIDVLKAILFPLWGIALLIYYLWDKINNSDWFYKIADILNKKITK